MNFITLDTNNIKLVNADSHISTIQINNKYNTT